MSPHKQPLSKKQIGILCMTIPFVVLFLLLLIYPLLNLSLIFGGGMGGASAGLRIVLGILGVLAFLGLLVGIPVGLYFFSRVEPHEVSDLGRHTAYEGLSHEQVEYIAKWSWTAFFLHWIWTLCNRGVRFWTLGFFTPVLQQYFWIKLSLHGRRMTWESGKWRSFAEFRRRQKVLAWVAWVWTILGSILVAYFVAKLPGLFLQSMMGGALRSETMSSEQRQAFQDALRANTFGGATTSSGTTDRKADCDALVDSDGDGLFDNYEWRLGTDVEKVDTDGDGFSDRMELVNKYNPSGEGASTPGQDAVYRENKTTVSSCAISPVLR